ncbi:uncharacterized protein N7477_001796 [Penicillium maclennaniae]|uniref:uncharacterized protein n=1 Tax=Penicillium maclennaniae TaxID=1343394 RepID=UPI002541A295|nr:uncharacterized protein N7477_001796 [Penicillium maclennaniae]KAJ5681856.1 hypothetical protein N7477_001796 [Penicillium maclennaniae]
MGWWHIASRGRFTGADKPLDENVPARPKGRRRDLSRERMRLEAQRAAKSSSSCLHGLDPLLVELHDMDLASLNPGASEHDKLLFEEFLRRGINVLHSTTAQESMLQPRLPQLCQESSALYPICIAFQLSLSASQTPLFFEYFDAALREFRSELARSTTLSDGTLTAGLLLCSTGLMHGLPWAMHLEGMHSILQSHGLDNSHRTSTTSKFRMHLLEVMGVMDLPCFAVGRQTPCIGIWRRYCRPAAPRQGIEPVTGLPRSLVDLFSGIGMETTEQSFWDWPGELGSFLQCYLQSRELSSFSAWRQSSTCPVDATVLVSRILANLDALRLACVERPAEDIFINNAVLYPFFITGLEVEMMNRNPRLQDVIRNRASASKQDGILLGLLEEMWRRNEPTLDVNTLAQSKDLEMGLL